MTGIFRILFFIFIGYLIFNAVRLLLAMGKARHHRKSSQGPNRGAGPDCDNKGERDRGDGGRTIELDKDQYKVE